MFFREFYWRLSEVCAMLKLIECRQAGDKLGLNGQMFAAVLKADLSSGSTGRHPTPTIAAVQRIRFSKEFVARRSSAGAIRLTD